MAAIAVQKPTLTAAAPTSTNCGVSGDTLTGCSSSAPLYLRFTNGSTSANVTIVDPTSQTPEAAVAFDPDVTFTIVSASRVIKISNPARFINPTTGVINLTYTSVTGLSVEAYQ